MIKFALAIDCNCNGLENAALSLVPYENDTRGRLFILVRGRGLMLVWIKA